MEKVDTLIIGAGVIGLAIAAKLSKKSKSLLLIDKNRYIGEETSSRNSEVIHAGIYYPQQSLKAQFCVSGKHKLYQYCRKNHIKYAQIGKFLVAQNDHEETFLEKTVALAKDNGVDDLVWRNKAQLANAEPALFARSALLSPSTGIIDVHEYMQSLHAEAESYGGLFVGQTSFIGAIKTAQGFEVQLNSQGELTTVHCQKLINCAGLHACAVAERIAEMPKNLIPTLHYCRGHYFSYQGKSPFQRLIYPIPEANGLGIHASLNVAGQLKFGPDTQYITILNYDVDESLKGKFVDAVRKYFPTLDPARLQPDYAGIRPKLQGNKDGFKDFMIQGCREHKIADLINLFGIDSPGLTSSLAIADYVEKQLN